MVFYAHVTGKQARQQRAQSTSCMLDTDAQSANEMTHPEGASAGQALDSCVARLPDDRAVLPKGQLCAQGVELGVASDAQVLLPHA